MDVQLVSITPDAEKTMAYIARVSNPSNQDNEKYAGLLRYCIKSLIHDDQVPRIIIGDSFVFRK